MMSLIARFSLLIVVVLMSACQPQNHPDSYITYQGSQGRFSDLHGQWVVINYWAVWCKPCIEEIPELNHFAANHNGKVALFGVDFDRTQGEVLQQGIDKLGIQFPVLVSDPTEALGYKRPNVLPTTLIINPQGKVHKTLLGPQTADSLTQAMGL